MTADDDFSPADLVFGELQLHKMDTSESIPFGSVDLDHTHREILKHLQTDKWMDRKELLGKTGLRRKALKKNVSFLKEHEYILERKKPNERRMKQYKKQ